MVNTTRPSHVAEGNSACFVVAHAPRIHLRVWFTLEALRTRLTSIHPSLSSNFKLFYVCTRASALDYTVCGCTQSSCQRMYLLSSGFRDFFYSLWEYVALFVVVESFWSYWPMKNSLPKIFSCYLCSNPEFMDN
ncbi:hypothetical protein VNO77_18362 [Canavalia gladiata]|uniref:Uncharacterized protein n=1 Tax=Canavalia gladiata TaxID=3824 RepID=A0AAN9QHL2_CANGL